jgi:hypothetical protein
MRDKLSKWIPIALCCLPGVTVAAILGIGVAFGGAAVGGLLSGPLGLGLLVLATLVCPMGMGLMMMRQRGSGQDSTPGNASTMVNCCLPGEEPPSDRLAALRAQREALERELAELQAK